MTAQGQLTRALAQLLDRGRRTPCQQSGSTRDYWTSDVREEREWAAASCRFCPVLPECRAAVEQMKERWGVWAGADRTRSSRPPKTVS